MAPRSVGRRGVAPAAPAFATSSSVSGLFSQVSEPGQVRQAETGQGSGVGRRAVPAAGMGAWAPLAGQTVRLVAPSSGGRDAKAIRGKQKKAGIGITIGHFFFACPLAGIICMISIFVILVILIV